MGESDSRTWKRKKRDTNKGKEKKRRLGWEREGEKRETNLQFLVCGGPSSSLNKL